MCFQQGMANPTLTYGMDGTNNVSVNTFTYQPGPPQQPPQQQQSPPIDSQSQLVQTQQPVPVAMQAVAGMAANSGYQILTQPQQQVQGSPTTTQQQLPPQQPVVSLTETPSDYSCGTPDGMKLGGGGGGVVGSVGCSAKWQE